MIFAWPSYGALLWVRGRRAHELLSMLPWMVAAVAVFVAFNEARFGEPYDIGMWLWYGQDKYRFASRWSAVLRHFPFNFYTVFSWRPSYSDVPLHPPRVHGPGAGPASPALILALRPNFLRPTTILVALAGALCAGPSMLWYANGFAQFGARY